MKRPCQVCVEIIRETPRAFLVADADPRDAVWVPKSQIVTEEDNVGPGDTSIITLPEWLAMEKGLV